MPRQLAIFLFTALVIWLWRQDNKSRAAFSTTLWIPLIWLLLLGSHHLSWWLWFFFRTGGATDSLEGNPLDRIFYSCLILVSIIILVRRRFSWSSLLQNNPGLVIFYAFLAASVFWADFPTPTLKRWIKEVGAVPVLMLILTEEDPIQAIKAVFSRCAYVLLSFSVLTIKYIPEIGRTFGEHSGFAEIHGIAQQKNALGECVMVFGLVLVWQILDVVSSASRHIKRGTVLAWVITLAMGIWLLHECDSQTSIVCFAMGTFLLLSAKIPVLSKRRPAILICCLVACPLFFILDGVFQVSGPLLELLGRDATLTNRTEIWAAVKANPVNPVLGCGYLNFWDRIGALDIGGNDVELKTAHNGYLEIFLDGGAIGVTLLTVMLVNVGLQQSKAFAAKSPTAELTLAYFCMTLLNNISESLFARRGPLWSAFLMSSFGWWLFAPSTPDETPEVAKRLDGTLAMGDSTFAFDD